jgi:small conductance mechanosensitive channel
LAVLILFVGREIGKWVTSWVRSAIKNSSIDDALVSFAGHLVYAALMAIVIISALNQVGIHPGSFIAIIGAAGLAVGLALQGSLANFAAGIMIIVFKPFKSGDFVDAGGTMGIVENIEIFSTKLRTGDNKLVIVPNNKITSNNIINYSAKETRRIDMVIGVSYQDDLARVKDVLQAILREDQRILEDPAPTIGVVTLGESSIDFVVRPWVKSADYWPTLYDLNQKIKETFDREGISIPFPQRDIHLFSADSNQNAG